jgi:hypothetical protein
VSIASFRHSVRASRRSARQPPKRVHLALIAWWRAAELDHWLAAGADPWTSDELALRARNLTTERSRARVANGLAGVVRSADRASAGLTAAQIRLVLIDGNGPLYRPSDPGALADELQAAAGALAYAPD